MNLAPWQFAICVVGAWLAGALSFVIFMAIWTWLQERRWERLADDVKRDFEAPHEKKEPHVH